MSTRREEATPRATRRAAAPTPPATPPKFFELIPPNPGIDFVARAPMMALLSCALIVVGLASMVFRGGLNYGIDFTGGTMVEVRFPQSTPIADVRAALEASELRSVSVQDVGGEGREFQVRAQQEGGDLANTPADAIKGALQTRFGEGSYDVLRVESVGPKVGRDLWRNAIFAVLAATLMMGTYIAVRFDLPVGVGAAAKLLHDVLFTLGALSLVNMEFDLTTVAALLTVVGFSVNDNVIISDRIREARKRNRKESLATLVNTSINETLSRTVINSGTVVLTTAALFFLGGPVIHSFAYALLVGFVIGTYSSIFISTPIVLFLEGRRTKRSA
jgi:preprotein translocase subunit SecF